MDELWWLIPGAILLLMVLVWAWFPVRAGWQRVRLAEARRDFHRQRERLEAKFVQFGVAADRPDAPHWTDCDFEDDVVFARNRSTGELSAFVSVAIRMQEGAEHAATGDDFTGNWRAATAVFRFTGRHWETDGRAIFNLSPTEALQFYHRDLELVAQDAHGKS